MNSTRPSTAPERLLPTGAGLRMMAFVRLFFLLSLLLLAGCAEMTEYNPPSGISTPTTPAINPENVMDNPAGPHFFYQPPVPPQPGTLSADKVAFSAPNPSSMPQLTLHGGWVMHSVNVYLIFWAPNCFVEYYVEFDNDVPCSDLDGDSTPTHQNRYINHLTQFIRDIGVDTRYRGLLSQYYSMDGNSKTPAATSISLGGAYIDRSAAVST